MTDEPRQHFPDKPEPELPLQDLERIFAPTWAREAPDEASRNLARHHKGQDDRDSGRDRREASRDTWRGRRDVQSARPPRRDARQRPSAHGRPAEGRPERRPDRSSRSVPNEAPLPLTLRLQPEQKALGAIIRRIQTSRRAFPLRDIVRLFLQNDDSLLLRVEPGQGEDAPSSLFQCRVCGMPGRTDEDVRLHLLRHHLEDFYDVEAIETEPPGGNFPCVARCGLSGELLGPPNHHSFGLRVQEMLRTRYKHMSEEDYRARIEMVHDREAIETWREQSRKRQLYRRKKETGPPPPSQAENGEAGATDKPAVQPDGMERHLAELQFAREILPQQIGSAKQLICPVSTLRLLADRRLANTLRPFIQEEGRRAGSLFFALRGAFRHRGLHLFRANDSRGPEFVCGIAPLPLDTTHAVAEVRQIMAHMEENAGSTRVAILEALAPGNETAQTHLNSQLNWLIEKGHVVSFFNGTLSVAANHPFFRPMAPAPRKSPHPGGDAGSDPRSPDSQHPTHPTP